MNWWGTFAPVIVGLLGFMGIIIASAVTYIVARSKADADLKAKAIDDKSQNEVVRIGANAAYTDDLRADITLLKADAMGLKGDLEISQEKWFQQQTEILDKQRQINELGTSLKALESRILDLDKVAILNRGECEAQILGLRAEITTLQDRCKVLEAERDAWKQKSEVADLENAGVTIYPTTEKKET